MLIHSRKLIAACSLLFSLTSFTGCGDSIVRLNQLAARGLIEDSAPVKTQVSVLIAAPPVKVWALLIDAQEWPKWQDQIGSVAAKDPLSNGASFTWQTGGTTIHSQVQLCETERRLSWTGTAFTAKAIHVWELAPESQIHTLVTVKESMDGPLIAHMVSSEDLSESDRSWMNALKTAAGKNLSLGRLTRLAFPAETRRRGRHNKA